MHLSSAGRTPPAGGGVGLFSTDRGHASRSHETVPERTGEAHGLTLGTDGTLEGDDLVVLEDDKERLQKDDGLAQAGIQVVMGGVDDLPLGCRLGRTNGGKFSTAKRKSLPRSQTISSRVPILCRNCERWVSKTRPSRSLMRAVVLFGAQKICRVEGRGVGNGAVVLGVPGRARGASRSNFPLNEWLNQA